MPNVGSPERKAFLQAGPALCQGSVGQRAPDRTDQASADAAVDLPVV